MDDANVGQLFFAENTFSVAEIPKMVDVHLRLASDFLSADIAGLFVSHPRDLTEVPPMLRVQVDPPIPLP